MIAITIDTDWAPLELVRSTIELVHSFDCKLTVFCTNPLEISADEIAMHPNFVDANDLQGPVTALCAAYPQARGLRSHSLFFTERLRAVYEQCEISYDSNAIQHLTPGIRWSPIARRTVSLPIYFMDRFHLEVTADEPCKFSTEQFHWDDDGLKVFDFHPIHIALNTPTVDWYERAKIHYHEPERLRDFVAPGPGTRTLLESILTHIQKRRLPTHTMTELAARAWADLAMDSRP